MAGENVLKPIPRKYKKGKPVPMYPVPAMVNTNSITEHLYKHVIGIPQDFVSDLSECMELYNLGLSPLKRPIGSFMLSGHTGTGKTLTAEEIASYLHGDSKLLKINCGEFNMEHEVARLIGAPPGYLGHRETTPLINQAKLNGITSEKSNISVVLFDELDKAAPAVIKLLLGIMDKAELKLGDNSSVNFERTLLLFTTNYNVKEKEFARNLGFNPTKTNEEQTRISQYKKKLPAEFISRLTGIYEFPPLTKEYAKKILDMEIHKMVKLFRFRRSVNTEITVGKSLKEKILQDVQALPFNRGARAYVDALKPVLLTLGRNCENIQYLSNIVIDFKNGEYVIFEKEKELVA